MLHIEHVKLMAAIVYKGISLKIFIYFAVIPCCAIREYACIFEAFFDRSGTTCATIATDNLSGCKIDCARERIVNTTDIQNQHAINKNPQVIVSIKLIYQRRTVIIPVLRHQEIVINGHAEVVIHCSR